MILLRNIRSQMGSLERSDLLSYEQILEWKVLLAKLLKFRKKFIVLLTGQNFFMSNLWCSGNLNVKISNNGQSFTWPFRFSWNSHFIEHMFVGPNWAKFLLLSEKNLPEKIFSFHFVEQEFLISVQLL